MCTCSTELCPPAGRLFIALRSSAPSGQSNALLAGPSLAPPSLPLLNPPRHTTASNEKERKRSAVVVATPSATRLDERQQRERLSTWCQNRDRQRQQQHGQHQQQPPDMIYFRTGIQSYREEGVPIRPGEGTARGVCTLYTDN